MYEIVDVAKHTGRKIQLYQMPIRYDTMYDIPAAIDTTQKMTIIAYVRFKVTTCLYLKLNNRAKSLSTLIAVIVNRETEDRGRLAK